MRDVPVNKAKELGAIALFGEKYGDLVRVIKFNDSIELCGGTHTSATGNIGLFRIMSESAIAAGVRRIEATTGEYAEKIAYDAEDTLKAIRGIFNNAPNLVNSVQKLYSENENFRKIIEESTKEKAIALKNTLLNNQQTINGIDVIILKGEYEQDFVKNVAFLLRNEIKNTAFISGSVFEGKPNLSLLYSDDLVAKGLNASKDIREAAPIINGGGGGQNFFASAGGKNPEGISAAITKLTELATK
jgi:alanyl-tRNA synthetase